MIESQCQHIEFQLQTVQRFSAGTPGYFDQASLATVDEEANCDSDGKGAAANSHACSR